MLVAFERHISLITAAAQRLVKVVAIQDWVSTTTNAVPRAAHSGLTPTCVLPLLCPQNNALIVNRPPTAPHVVATTRVLAIGALLWMANAAARMPRHTLPENAICSWSVYLHYQE